MSQYKIQLFKYFTHFVLASQDFYWFERGEYHDRNREFACNVVQIPVLLKAVPRNLELIALHKMQCTERYTNTNLSTMNA